jgi:5-methylcytosine-specific restriction endonuclease McrA
VARRKTGPCCYCGKVGPLTDDHVPPRALFPEEFRQGANLATVPSCESCNLGASGG